jgi:hypothetical protein
MTAHPRRDMPPTHSGVEKRTIRLARERGSGADSLSDVGLGGYELAPNSIGARKTDHFREQGADSQ